MLIRNYRLLILVSITLTISIIGGWAIGSGTISIPLMFGISLAFAGFTFAFSTSSWRIRKPIFLLFLLTLFVFPIARLNIGSLPIYFIDVALIIIWLDIFLSKSEFGVRFNNSPTLIMLLLAYWIPSTILVFLHEILLTQVILETTYMLVRTLLSIGIAVVIVIYISSVNDYYQVLSFVVVALIFTSVIGILTAVLPPSNPVLLMLDSLTPTQLASKQELYIQSTGVVRSGGLIGGPNHFGNLIVILWSLSLGLYLHTNSKQIRRLTLIALSIGPIALIFTYTRSAYLGFFLMLCWYFIRLRTKQPQIIIGFLCAMVTILLLNDWFNIINFDYILERFESIVGSNSTSTSESYSNQTRILAYLEVPDFLLNHPSWLVVGRGFATFDLWLRGLLSQSFLQSPIANTQNHSLIVMTFYQRGLIGVLLLIGLWINAFTVLNRESTKSFSILAISLQACLIGMIPAWLFDHFFASTVHMQTIMFIIWGLAISLTYLSNQNSNETRGYG